MLILLLVKPTIKYLPFQLKLLKIFFSFNSPLISKTILAPLLLVNSITSFLMSLLIKIIFSTPISFSKAAFFLLLTIQITFAFKCKASLTQACPTPPEAPVISIKLFFFILAFSNKAT